MKEERKKTIEELRRERKEREKNDTPENRAKQAEEEAAAKVAAFKAKVASDARALLAAEEDRQKAAKKEACLAELRAAIGEVRKLAGQEDQGGEQMKPAKLRVAKALQAATAAGIDQEEIVEATTLEPEPQEAGSGSKDGTSEAAAPEDTTKKDIKKERLAVREAAHAAAVLAKQEGRPAAEIAKMAAVAAKAYGGDATAIQKAAVAALKIAKGEDPQYSDIDSSSSSSSSSESEREEDIGQWERDKAKRDGIAAAFYFGRGR